MSVAGGSILASSVMYKSLSCHVSVQQQFINSIYLKKTQHTCNHEWEFNGVLYVLLFRIFVNIFLVRKTYVILLQIMPVFSNKSIFGLSYREIKYIEVYLTTFDKFYYFKQEIMTAIQQVL